MTVAPESPAINQPVPRSAVGQDATAQQIAEQRRLIRACVSLAFMDPPSCSYWLAEANRERVRLTAMLQGRQEC